MDIEIRDRLGPGPIEIGDGPGPGPELDNFRIAPTFMCSWDPKHTAVKEVGVSEESVPCGAQIQFQDKLKYCGCLVSPINMKDGMLTHPTDTTLFIFLIRT